MTYETIPIESEDAGAVHVLTGTVTDIDDENIKVDVNIDGHGVVSDIPVFYHCPDSETADGNPFVVDDRAVIVNYGDAEELSVADMKAVGFEDGLPRECPYEFYIRPTFNGYSPTYGGENIKLENDFGSETGTTTVEGDFAGLCGPFTQDVDTGDEYIYLNKWVAAGVNPNYIGINNIFAHFVEVEEDADYHFGYNFRELAWYSAGKKQFECGSGVGTPILHINRVDWLRYGNILSECPKTTETIDGKDYDIYQVDFTELYFPGLTLTHKAKLSDGDCDLGCGSIVISDEDPIFYAITIGAGLASVYSTYGNCDGFGEACADELPECKAYFVDAIVNHTAEFELEKEQICILSDEYGQNTTYTPVTINNRMYIHEQEIYRPYGDGTICKINTTDYANYREYKYEMVLAPENKF